MTRITLKHEEPDNKTALVVNNVDENGTVLTTARIEPGMEASVHVATGQGLVIKEEAAEDQGSGNGEEKEAA